MNASSNIDAEDKTQNSNFMDELMSLKKKKG